MRLLGKDAESVQEQGELVYLTGDHPEDENSFANPRKARAQGGAGRGRQGGAAPAPSCSSAHQGVTSSPRRLQVAPAGATIDGLSSQFVLPVEPWSVNVLQLHLGAGPLATGAAAAA